MKTQPALDDPKDPSTREHILAAAAQLFSERGFANVSIRDLCEDVGVTPPTVYHYFGNKDRLFHEVIQRRLNLEDFRRSLFASVRAQVGAQAKLGEFILHYLAHFPREFFNPGMFLQSTTTLSAESTLRVMGEFKQINDLARSIIQDGIQEGIFSPLEPGQVTEYLMNILMAYVLVEVHYMQAHEPESTAQFIYNLLLNGLLANSPST